MTAAVATATVISKYRIFMSCQRSFFKSLLKAKQVRTIHVLDRHRARPRRSAENGSKRKFGRCIG